MAILDDIHRAIQDAFNTADSPFQPAIITRVTQTGGGPFTEGVALSALTAASGVAKVCCSAAMLPSGGADNSSASATMRKRDAKRAS